MRERCRTNDPDADRPSVGKTEAWVRSNLLSTTALCSALGAMLAAAPAYANPKGGTVVGGQVTITQTAPNRVDINQTTDKGIINWQGFSIGSGEHTNFKQPSSQSITLNRVVGGNPSEILGRMTANGNVWIVNPQGVFFGPGAQINVGGLLATTHDIKNEDFMAGRYVFQSDRQPPGIIENQGTITAADAGLVAFVAPGVVNHGVINARLGQVALAAGNQFTVDLYGDQKINLALDRKVTETVVGRDGKPLDALVNNDGSIFADGGRVFLSAVAARGIVNNVITAGGVIEARAVDQRGGEIILSGGDGGTTQVTGTLDASGRNAGQSGGMVQVFGDTVALLTGARIDVSGAAGGGTVLIGGDLRGGAATSEERATYKVPAVSKLAGPNATAVRVEAGATIMADATISGRGGAVVVWSDGVTSLYGNISARGGTSGGDGGFVEVSGKQKLDFAGTVDRRAPAGLAGMLLLDPENIAIVGNGDMPTLPASGGTTLTGTSNNSRLSVSRLQNALALGDVTVQTGAGGNQTGDIEVTTDIRWSTGSALTLSAYDSIIVDSGVTIANTGRGNLNLRADNTGAGTGSVSFLGTGKIDYLSSTGLVSIYYNPVSNPAGSGVNSTSYTSPTDYSSHVRTNGGVQSQLTSYMLVNTVYDLQNINNNLSGNYALGKDIDASVTANWNNGTGFTPIGSDTQYPSSPLLFRGQIDGLGHSVSNVYISSNNDYVVGFILDLYGSVKNVSLVNASIHQTTTSTTDNYRTVGGLVGFNDGTIIGSSITGIVTATWSSTLGGLVGTNTDNGTGRGGIIDSSYSLATVTNLCAEMPLNATGGLVGLNEGTITRSYASGAVTGGPNSWVGGLVGWNHTNWGPTPPVNSYGGIISASYANGLVTGTEKVGGLIGASTGGQVRQSYSSSPMVASTGSDIGGLAGSEGGWAYTTYENNYWDRLVNTTGSAAGNAVISGVTGESTDQLKSGSLPYGFDPVAWAVTAGQYPKLTWQTVNNRPTSTTVNFGTGFSTLRFSTDLSLSPNMTLSLKFDPIQSDKLIVDGAFHLDGILQITPLDGIYSAGTRYPIITAQSVTGTFSDLLINNPNALGGLTVGIDYLNNEVDLELIRQIESIGKTIPAPNEGSSIITAPVVVSGDRSPSPGTGGNAGTTTPPSGGSPPNGDLWQALGQFQRTPPSAQPTNPGAGNNGSTLPDIPGLLVNSKFSIFDTEIALSTNPSTKFSSFHAVTEAASGIMSSVGIQARKIYGDVIYRNEKGLDYAKSDKIVKDAVFDFFVRLTAVDTSGNVSKLISLEYGTGEAASSAMVDSIVNAVKSSPDIVSNFKAGNYYEGTLSMIDVVSTAIVKIGGGYLIGPIAMPLTDLLRVSTAFTTSYLYGFLVGV